MNDDPIRPSVKITEPEPLKIIDKTASDVEIMVRPFALGECRVLLNIVADECAFLVNNEIGNQVETTVNCENVRKAILVNVPFTVICTDPSKDDILIRFTASAINSQGGKSLPSPLFNVDLGFDEEDQLAEIIASAESNEIETRSDDPSTNITSTETNSGGVVETEVRTRGLGAAPTTTNPVNIEALKAQLKKELMDEILAKLKNDNNG